LWIFLLLQNNGQSEEEEQKAMELPDLQLKRVELLEKGNIS